MAAIRALVPLFVLATACSATSSVPAAPTEADAGAPDADPGHDATARADAGTNPSGPIGGQRPVTVHAPPGYVAGTALPLVLLLHGHSVSGEIEDAYLRLTQVADSRKFLYAHPDGTSDAMGVPFWNPANSCCDFDGKHTDDSGYLSLVIKQIAARYTVDPKRVYIVGHSNGGFMAYQMACDHADQIAAIVSLAGAMYPDLKKCTPTEPVSILEIHGTADTTVPYDGVTIGGVPFPGAVATVASWVTLDGCGTTADTSAPSLDLDSSLDGNETTVTTYAKGCRPGGHAALWSIAGGEHVPAISATFSPAVVDFLFAHPKP